MRKLTFISGELNGLTCELKSNRTTVGREDGNDFKVPDGLVSSHHCEVLLVNGDVVVRDLNSRNGIFIDGKRVTEGVLRPGQVLRLAEVEARLDVEDDSAGGDAGADGLGARAMEAGKSPGRGRNMQRCLTCAKEFALEAVDHRCVNTKCVEADAKLSEFMLGFDQVLGTVIPPNGSHKRADVQCHKCGTPTSIRLCPHCHGELPTYLDDVPGHTVYILGPKGCGKSLYLVATFEHLEKQVFPTRLKSHFEFCTRYTKERYKKLRDRVYRSRVLLDATRAERTDPDLVLPFIFNANLRSYVPFFYPLSRNRAVNIAAFDTSGEDCEKLEALQWCCQGLPRSSALIILVDPTAFPSIASQLPLEAKTSIVEQVGNAKTVIDNVTQFYRASRRMGVNEKVPIPTAFVLTKVDALRTLFDPASRIFQEAEHRGGYDRDYCEQVSQDVKSFLRDQRIGGDNIVTAAETGFSDHLFFAATSLGKPPRVEAGHKLADNINPKNPENPWLWILHRLGLLSEA